MAIYVIIEKFSDDRAVHSYSSIYRSSKIAFDEYINFMSEIIWRFNTCLDYVVENVKALGNDKARCTLSVYDTRFSFSNGDGTYASLEIEKKEYDKNTKQYEYVPDSLRFTKKRAKECIERVKLLRDKERNYENNSAYFKYWTDEKIETMLNYMFKYIIL